MKGGGNMDAGQITQGLRADSFQQGAQNGNFMQLMESGVSFADIMRMITSNNKSMSDVLLNMPGITSDITNIPNMQDELLNSDMPLMDAEQNLFANMQNLISQAGLQNVAGFSNMQELKNLLNSVNPEKMPDNLSDDNLGNFTGEQLVDNLNPIIKDEALININNNIKLDKQENAKLSSDLKDLSNSDLSTVFEQEIDSEDSTIVHNPNVIEELNNSYASNEVKKEDNTIKGIEQDSKNADVVSDVKLHINFSDKLNTDESNAIEEELSGILQSDTSETDEKIQQNVSDNENSNVQNAKQETVFQVKNESNEQVTQNVKNVLNIDDLKHTKSSEQNENVKADDKKTSYDVNVFDKLEGFLNLENADSKKPVNIKNNIEISPKKAENVFNVNNVINDQVLHIITEKLGIINNGSQRMTNAANPLNDNVVDNLSDKLVDVFNVVSPEILKSAVNETGNVNNDNKFVIDLLSALNNENDIRDVFDFSDSVLKVDPLQLAGLLDYISTGSGIPQAMDISDNTLFKNIDNANAAEKVSGNIIFDPKEMIESGEMEIVSYIPAEKKTQSNPQENLQQENNFAEKGEKTIDFARTMKSVRENVKPALSDDDEKSIETHPSLTAEEMNNVAQKVDISFDRAYAELEMNKAKYGSAEQQLSKGIAENLKSGRREFTVKLRPEGLGEILVKLVSDDGGKTLLSMVASSEKTAQLLNRDLASLQSSLNEHNVEIEGHSVKTVENVNSSQTAFSQYDERRQDEANQENQYRNLRNKLGNISVGNASFDNETEPIQSKSVDSVLNITI